MHLIIDVLKEVLQKTRIWAKNSILYLLTKPDTLKVSMHLLNANGSERIRCFCGLKDLTLFNFLCSNLTRTKKFTDVSRWLILKLSINSCLLSSLQVNQWNKLNVFVYQHTNGSNQLVEFFIVNQYFNCQRWAPLADDTRKRKNEFLFIFLISLQKNINSFISLE